MIGPSGDETGGQSEYSAILPHHLHSTALTKKNVYPIPDVSIGMPVYNGEKTIRRAIDSIISQTYKNIEIIISDNNSKDKTLDIIKNYASQDNRIKIYRQNRNIGAKENFRFVCNRALGSYFMWAACDDWWDPTFIATLKNKLDNKNKYGVAMCSLQRFTDNEKYYDEIKYSENSATKNIDYIAIFRKMIKLDSGNSLHFFIYGLFRTEILKKLTNRLFPECISGDRLVMCELALSTGFYAVPKVLHRRYIADKTIIERYGDEELGKYWRNKKRFTIYVKKMIMRILSSPIIPMERKIKAIPIMYQYIWKKRGVILDEHPIVKNTIKYFMNIVKRLR